LRGKVAKAVGDGEHAVAEHLELRGPHRLDLRRGQGLAAHRLDLLHGVIERLLNQLKVAGVAKQFRAHVVPEI
jgi:hypothetical protein